MCMNQGYLIEGVTVSGVRTSIGEREGPKEAERREVGRWMYEVCKLGSQTNVGGKHA